MNCGSNLINIDVNKYSCSNGLIEGIFLQSCSKVWLVFLRPYLTDWGISQVRELKGDINFLLASLDPDILFYDKI